MLTQELVNNWFIAIVFFFKTGLASSVTKLDLCHPITVACAEALSRWSVSLRKR